MVKIRRLSGAGDKLVELSLPKALQAVEQNLKDNLVYNEDTKQMITKATMGQIKEDTNLALIPVIEGG